MSQCTNHPHLKAKDFCSECGKAFCMGCLLLLGPKEKIICNKCYRAASEKIQKVIIRGMVSVIFLVITGVLTLFYGFVLIGGEGLKSIPILIIGALLLGLMALTIRYLRNQKDSLTVKRYPPD